MGAKAFFKPTPTRIGPTGMNMTARANAAPGFAARAAGAGAQKDIAAAAALSKDVLKPAKKTAAADAPGPKV